MYGDNKDEIVQLYLDDIIPNRFQPREVFDERALKELAVSIKEHGVIQPIIVRNVNGKYEIIAGERRYKASALAGQTKIPAIIRNLDDKESSKVALLENLQRKNLNAIEEARTYQKILEIDQMTQEELAKTMGKSQSAVANKLRLLNLPDEVQEALLKEQISERHARALLNVPDTKKQKELLNKVIEEKISVRKLEEEINNLYPKEKKESEEENYVTQATNRYLNDKPLTPTSINVDEENNYGKVTIAPPQEGDNTNKFINYGEIGKKDEVPKVSNGFELPETTPPIMDINQIKDKATDINNTSKGTASEIDGMLNLTGGPITPAEKIVKDTITASEKEEKPSDDYFKPSDLSAVPNPTIDIEDNSQIISDISQEAPTNISQSLINPIDSVEDKTEEISNNQNYTVEEATEKIRNLVDDLRSHGVSINADEMNFPKSYQVIIKIER